MNVRIGHATNSSSTHSVVLLPGAGLRDRLLHETEYAFSWDFFIAASTEEKMRYLAAITYHSMLSEGLSRELAAQACSLLFNGIESIPESIPEVDHNSAFILPRDWDGNVFDMRFFGALKAFMRHSSVYVLGGNDNDDDEFEHLRDAAKIVFPSRVLRSGGFIARDDGTHFVLFNRKTGVKVRICLDPSLAGIKIIKAATPELVDMKITNHCSRGCDFCYQDSGPGESTKEPPMLRVLIHAMAKLQVFEIAFGGGEVTELEWFPDILAYARRAGIVPNFTTASTEWLLRDEYRENVYRHIGAFAYSAQTADEAMAFCKLLRRVSDTPVRAAIQTVVGGPWERKGRIGGIARVCAKYNLPLTLLGFKRTGRAANLDSRYELAEEDLRSLRDKSIRVSVDTALAGRMLPILEEWDVPEALYETEEGKFSAYIDATSMKIGPSSYCSRELMSSLRPDNAEGLAYDIWLRFSQW